MLPLISLNTRSHSLGHELFVVPKLANSPLRNHRDAVGVSHGGQPVRHDQGSAALLRLEVVEGRLDLDRDGVGVGVAGRVRVRVRVQRFNSRV